MSPKRQVRYDDDSELPAASRISSFPGDEGSKDYDRRKAFRRSSTQNTSRKESRRSSQQEGTHTRRFEDDTDTAESRISSLVDVRSKDDDRRKTNRRISAIQHTTMSERLRSSQEKRHTSCYDDSTDIPSSRISSFVDRRSKDNDHRKMYRRSSAQNTSRSESLRSSTESSYSSRYSDSTDIPSSRTSLLVDARVKDDDRLKIKSKSIAQSISTKTASGKSTSRYDDAMEFPLSSVKDDLDRQRANRRNSIQLAPNRMGNGKSSQEITANYYSRYDNGTGGSRSSIQHTSKKSEIVRLEREITHSSDKQPFDMSTPLPRRTRRHQLVSTASKHDANSEVNQQMRTLKLTNEMLNKKILTMEKEIKQYKATEILLRNELKRNEKRAGFEEELQGVPVGMPERVPPVGLVERQSSFLRKGRRVSRRKKEKDRKKTENINQGMTTRKGSNTSRRWRRF